MKMKNHNTHYERNKKRLPKKHIIMKVVKNKHKNITKTKKDCKNKK